MSLEKRGGGGGGSLLIARFRVSRVFRYFPAVCENLHRMEYVQQVTVYRRSEVSSEREDQYQTAQKDRAELE